jgi:hypothetical protein
MPLNQTEEGFLKKFIRDATPRFRQAATLPPQASLDLDTLAERELNRQPRLATLDINADLLIGSALDRAGIRLKPGEVFSLGLSRDFILRATASELKAAVERAKAQNAAQGVAEPKHQAFSIPAVQPAAMPPRAARVGKNIAIEIG